MMRLVVASALLASMVSAAHSAPDGQTVATACNVATICPGVKPGGGRILGCLKAHQSSLSNDCLAALESSRGGKSVSKQQPNAADHSGQVLQSDGTYAPASGNAQ